MVWGLAIAVRLHEGTCIGIISSKVIGGDGALIALRVDDLDAYLAEVKARGATVIAGPVEFGGRTRNAYLRDPEGNLIEIQQWLKVRDGDPIPPAS